MKLRALVAALAALFALQSGVAAAATNTTRTSGKAATEARKAAAKPVVKPKAVAAKAANKPVAAKKAAVKPAPQGRVASKAQPTKKAAAKVNVKTRAVKAATRGKAAPMRVTLRKAAPAALAVAPATLLADEPDQALAVDASGMPVLASSAFYVINQNTGEVLLERNGSAVLPIASITKLMTAMVVLDAGQSLSEPLVITDEGDDGLPEYFPPQPENCGIELLQRGDEQAAQGCVHPSLHAALPNVHCCTVTMKTMEPERSDRSKPAYLTPQPKAILP